LEGRDFGPTELLYRVLPGGTEEGNRKPVRIACVPTEIRTENLSYTSLERYPLSSRVANIASDIIIVIICFKVGLY
jgi:hypothetical protein